MLDPLRPLTRTFTSTREPQPVEDRHKAIDGEPREIRIAKAREIGRRDPGPAVRGPHGQSLPVKRLDDFSCQDCFDLPGIRVLVAEVSEHVAITPL